MADAIHPDMAAALDAKGVIPIRWELVSTLRGPLARVAYRVELEDGRTIKARRLEDADAAQRIWQIRREFPYDFAPVLAVHGTVLLEEWLDGRPLGAARPDDARLREAGRLLARLHGLARVAGRSVEGRDHTASHRNDADRGLDALVLGGHLDGRSARTLREVLAAEDPVSGRVGVTHNDLCGENILVDPAGRLRVFDNERVAVGMLGFDVGRSWYRWDLDRDAWDVFERAYSNACPGVEPSNRLAFWGLVAVVKSAVYRLRVAPATVEVPLERLRRIANGDPR